MTCLTCKQPILPGEDIDDFEGRTYHVNPDDCIAARDRMWEARMSTGGTEIPETRLDALEQALSDPAATGSMADTARELLAEVRRLRGVLEKIANGQTYKVGTKLIAIPFTMFEARDIARTALAATPEPTAIEAARGGRE